MRVVFDANVVTSASFWRGTPFDCLTLWAAGKCDAVVSADLLAEYHETIEELRLEYPSRPLASGRPMASELETDTARPRSVQ